MKNQTDKLPVPFVVSPSASQTPPKRMPGFLSNIRLSLLCGSVALGFGLQTQNAQSQSGPTNFNAMVPIYHITQAGLTLSQASIIANYLNMSIGQFYFSNGLTWFFNPTGYCTIPLIPLNNPGVVSNLTAQTANQFPQLPISVQVIDFSALSNLTVPSHRTVMTLVSNTLNVAGVSPTYCTQVVNHATFVAFYSNVDNVLISASNYLDTGVAYNFTDPNGYPIKGPGAQIHFNYTPSGTLSHLIYSADQLTPIAGTSVQLMSQSQASNAITPLFPPGAVLNYYVVYWCPPLIYPPDPCSSPPPTWNPQIVIPYYYCTGTMSETNPLSGIVSTISFSPQIIPAFFGTNYLPQPVFNPSGAQGSNLIASVSVTGGTPPYSYVWSASDPNVSSTCGPEIEYTPIVRVGVPTLAITEGNGSVIISWGDATAGFMLESTPSLGGNPVWSQVPAVQDNNGVSSVEVPNNGIQFYRLVLASQTLPVTETVTVTVTDANGVSVHASQSIEAQAIPIQSSTQDPAIDYGCESPYDPGLGSGDRASWLAGMAAGPGGGFQRFCWTGASAWPGDFIEPKTPGILPALPWINGDADYLNWGVNAADIVLYIGHGNPDVVSFVVYNFGNCGYVSPVSFLWEPWYEETYGTSAVEMANTCVVGPPYWNVPSYLGAWRNSGPTPNDNLYWLCLLSCEVLQEYDGAGLGAWTRWGPAFNGLHILTGFQSLAEAGTGFPGQFAHNILNAGGGGTMTIVQGWRNAAAMKGTGTAASMGPINVDGVSDFTDYYWGKGPVGPSIPKSQIRGWWYIN
jgi:hypothetical protein